jgi:hypothetical protein
MNIYTFDQNNNSNFQFNEDEPRNSIPNFFLELKKPKHSIVILSSEDLIHKSRKKELHQITLDDFSSDFKTYFNFSKIVVFKAYQESKILKNRLTLEDGKKKLETLNLDLGNLIFES